ncbi:chaperone protein dnaJ 11, chloroplastic-like [Phalaenopsis equestris]|uniref:chaperone protein dnaJ 11, chloroplastic-like n=1 Tax=Phalaenopsis equestris TaxID=78828 RepID=UPI0009E4182C|nr:chaperone protein dnaJ 11, chloroplastic-like [Phalaenopsis equestris]
MIASPNLSLPRRPHFLRRRNTAPRPFLQPLSLPLRSPTIAAATPAESAFTTPPTPISLYNVLGLEEKASTREIKAAYRSLARTCHPDVHSGASADKFLSVHAAYSTLSDPSKRAEYDRELIALRRSPVRICRFSGHVPRRTWETDQCW